MKIPHIAVTKNAIWTVGGFGLLQAIRLATSVVLTRLLAPELFGIMVVVNSLRMGIELITDLGIGQNIVYNRDAEDPDFYNTAWTIQTIRGLFLWVIACAATVPVAHYYEAPILLSVMPVASFILVISGFAPVSGFLLQRRLQVAKLNVFEIVVTSIWSVEQLALAYFIPTVWALVIGAILGSATSTFAGFFLLPDVKHRFKISKRYAWEIVHFGKWIFFSSMVYFASTNFDRLYLAGVIPFALLGVYGIARSISELLSALAVRLGNGVIFPFIASHSATPRAELRGELVSIRAQFFLISAIGFAVSAAFADIAIKLVFDQRYHAAGWMVPVLIIGTWVSLLCSVNESTLLGFGKPQYATAGFSFKFAWLLVGLPFCFAHFGPVGAILVIAVSDIFRYLPALIGQIQQRFAFGTQDFLMTLLMLGLLALFEWLRWSFGLGTSFDELPIFN